LTVRVCKKPSCEEVTEDELKRLLSKLSGLPLENFEVKKLGTADDDKCCQRFAVSISAEKNSGFDVNEAKTNLSAALDGSSELAIEDTQASMDTQEEASSASTVVASAALTLAAIVAM